jgi:hypothetical protein
MARAAIALVLLVLVLAGTSTADVPHRINYQGVLKDGAGVPVPDGDYDLTFRLYDVEVGGTALWTESQTVPVADAIFFVKLGAVTPFVLPFDDQYWLGISIGTDSELTPRLELTAAPYALRAAVAESVVVGVPDGDWIVSGDNMYSAVPGSVGVGTSAPQERLDVDGTARVVGFKMPTGASLGHVLTSDADGVGTWQPVSGGGGIGGSGTAKRLAKFTGPDTIGNSVIYQDGDGRIGIRSLDPQETLTVVDADTDVSTMGVRALGPLPSGLSILKLETGQGSSDDCRFISCTAFGGYLMFSLYGDGDFHSSGSGSVDGDMDVVGAVQSDTGFEVYKSGWSSPVAYMNEDYSGDGGYLRLNDEAGSMIVQLDADVDGDGGHLAIRTRPGDDAFDVDGDYSGTGEPRVEITGSSRGAYFHMDQTGDSSVLLPNDAVSAPEVLDEPGIAAQVTTSNVWLSEGTPPEILALRTLTPPADGYVFVIGTFRTGPAYPWTCRYDPPCQAEFTIGLTPTDFGDDEEIWVAYGLDGVQTWGFSVPAVVSEMFVVDEGIPYTFHLLGRSLVNTWIADAINLSVMYFPSAYGTVVTNQGGAAGDGSGESGGVSAAEAAAERAEGEAFHLTRLEREMAEMRARIETLEKERNDRE